jgi:DNA-binding MarR family transcriptional regulator
MLRPEEAEEAGAGSSIESGSSVHDPTAGPSPDMPQPKNPPFVDRYVPALLAQASRLISAEFHAVVEAKGLSVSEWRVLSTLVGCESMSIGHLAHVAVTKQPTVTRLLDRMEAQGHVERLSHDTDKRVTMVRITPSGRKIVAGLIARAEAHEKSVLEPLGTKRAEELRGILRRLIDLHRPRIG